MRAAAFAALMFLSGASALLFETLWLRLSGLAFGNSVWSAALTLSSFMAGLALGSFLATRFPVQRVRPIRFYAVLEVVVALSGCSLVFVLPALGDALRPLFQLLWDDHAVLNVIRLLGSFLILLVPTTAIGLTLPLLLDDPILRGGRFERDMALLYGANTLGALAGAVSGESYLVEAYGLWGTAFAAAGMNLVAAGGAVLISLVMPARDPAAPISRARLRLWPESWRCRSLLFGSMFAGALLLCLEVVWFRFLRLYVASSPLAFAVMLAVVLAGIGIGALVAGTFQRGAARRDSSIAVVGVAAAVAVLLSYLFFPVPQQSSGASAYIESWQKIALLSCALMFPVSFLSGLMLPWITASVQEHVGSRVSGTGLTILFNTVGAAVGPWLGSFLLLPSVGYEWALVICAVGYGFLGLLLSERQHWSLRHSAGRVLMPLAAALLILLAAFPYGRDEAHFANARKPYEADGSKLIRKIEGNSETFQVLQSDVFGQPYYHRLVTNGFSMSGTLLRSQRYMRLFAYLPLTLRRSADDVLLICYGVGVTADAFVRDGEVKRIDVVDTAREVYELADSYVRPGEQSPLRDPRVTTFVQDGRFFLQASQRKYDVITGEPPPLKVAGTVNLYTEEFFKLMRSQLKDGGIATFWLPVYQLTVDESKAILRAFHNAFENASVWASSDQEWILMGINGPGEPVTDEQLRRLWQQAETGEDLRRIGIEDPAQLAALFVMDSAEIQRITADVQPLTDIYPKRLGDAAPDPEATHRFVWRYLEAVPALANFRSSALTQRLFPTVSASQMELFFVVRETRYLSQLIGSNWLAELDLYLRHSRLRSPVLEVLHTDAIKLSLAKRLSSTADRPPAEAVADLVAGRLADRDLNGAVILLEGERQLKRLTSERMFLLTYLYCLTGRIADAEALAQEHLLTANRDWFTSWTWNRLQAEFGFRPPV